MTHTQKWDFGIQTDHLISARRPDLVVTDKKKLWTLLSRLTTEQNWKKVKRSISTSALLGNWKSYGTWRWRLYQSWLMLLVQSPKDYWRDWWTWRLKDERRPSKLQHYWKRSEYWEESWRLEETCCHSNFSERPSADADTKNSQGVNNNNYYYYYWNKNGRKTTI